MTDGDRRAEKLIASLQERAKELNCLYEVEQICSQTNLALNEVFQKVVDAIPPGPQGASASLTPVAPRRTTPTFRR